MNDLRFKVDSSHTYDTIMKYVDSTYGEAEIEEFGYNEEGCHFLIIDFEGNKTSFALTGYSRNDSEVYQVIHSEI